jgi:hypothetical protein
MQRQSLVTAIALTVIASMAAAEPSADRPVITSHIPRQRVESIAISEIGYSKRRHWLELKFANGGIYRYLDVPPSVYRDLISAESKAAYYGRYIKRNYRSIRVRPRVKDETAH